MQANRVPYTPHNYQVFLRRFFRKNKFCAGWAWMGLGKTAPAAFAASDLLFTEQVNKVLVVGPNQVIESSWPDELTKWEGLEDMPFCTLQVKTRSALSRSGHRIRKFSYDNSWLGDSSPCHLLPWSNFPYLVDHYGPDWPYDMVILDEACGYKDPSTYRSLAARKMRRYTDRIIQLTGTPAAEGYLDLWSQVAILDQGERLGIHRTTYQDMYFATGYRSYDLTLRPGAQEAINDRLGDICVTLSAEDYLKLPDRTDVTVPVKLSAKELSQYNEMKKESILEVTQETSGGVEYITADAQAGLSNKLLQLCNGAIYPSERELETDARKPAVRIHDRKLDALERIVNQADGPVLVAYKYQFDAEVIRKKYGKKLTLLDSREEIARWNDRQYAVGLIHPQSAAGLNLQKGSHTLVFFGLLHSLRQYLQTCARLDRQGQDHPVLVYHIVMEGGYDEKILPLLTNKQAKQDQLMAALKAEAGETLKAAGHRRLQRTEITDPTYFGLTE